MLQAGWRLLAALSLCAAGLPAQAHSFGQVYNLPVPFWLYAWGATAALVASFLVAGIFITARVSGTERRAAVLDISDSRLMRWLHRLRVLPLAQALSVAGLLLCIVTGLWGSNSPYGNFNMTFFWILFILGFTYLTALIGNVYALINPWQLLVAGLQWLWRGYGKGLIRYPARFGHWPALLLYMAFIWLELLGRSTPFSLAVGLCLYSLLNLLAVWLIGRRDWFRYCEFLSLFFRLVAQLAPVDIRVDEERSKRAQVTLRWPFAGLLQAPAADRGVLLFILFMLSSTAFDGLHETVTWRRLFWDDLYKTVLIDWVGSNPLAAFPAMRQWLLAWQSVWLLVSPWLYWLLYTVFVWLCCRVAGGNRSVRELGLQFAPTLLPIALVYNISHYYTLIQTQGVKIVTLASDPFGFGWNLFGTAKWLQRTIIPDAGTVWHAQVGLIVVGHVVSVVMAHKLALRLFPDRRQAVLSQLPMLVLMVLFTVAGLWVMSQPIS